LTAAENALREATTRHSDAHMRHASEITRCINSAEVASAAHAALRERGQLLEQALGEAKGRQTSELASLQSSHERLCLDVQEIRATLLGDFERMLEESAGKHAQDLQELKAQHELHAETHGQRLGLVEAAHTEHAERRAQELDALHGRLGALDGHHERHSTTVQELECALRVELADIIARIEALGGCIEDGCLARDRQHVVVQALSTRFENDRGVIEKHSATLQELAGIVDSKVESLNGRFEHERLARDRQYVSVQELAAGVDTKVEALSGRFEADRIARDRQYLSVQDAVLREKDQRDGHNASLKENLAYLETMIGNVSDRHGRDILAMKDSNGKLVKELRVLTGELGEQQARLEKLRSRVPLVRGLWAEGLAIDGQP